MINCAIRYKKSGAGHPTYLKIGIWKDGSTELLSVFESNIKDPVNPDDTNPTIAEFRENFYRWEEEELLDIEGRFRIIDWDAYKIKSFLFMVFKHLYNTFFEERIVDLYSLSLFDVKIQEPNKDSCIEETMNMFENAFQTY